MRIRLIGITLFSTLVLVACSSFNVDSDYDDSFDFASIQSYRWFAGNEYNQKTKTLLNNDILDKRIRDNVDRVLQAKGYNQDMTGEGDFLVNYSITSEPRVDVNTYNTYSGFAPGWGYGYYGRGPYMYGGVGYANTETRVTHYDQGTLVVDIIDPVNNKLVWRGTADGRIPKKMTQEEKELAVQNVINKVMETFPPE